MSVRAVIMEGRLYRISERSYRISVHAAPSRVRGRSALRAEIQPACIRRRQLPAHQPLEIRLHRRVVERDASLQAHQYPRGQVDHARVAGAHVGRERDGREDSTAPYSGARAPPECAFRPLQGPDRDFLLETNAKAFGTLVASR